MVGHKIRLALIGCGYWGPNFIRVIQNSSTAALMAVCDSDSAVRAALAAKYQAIKVVAEAREIFNDEGIDAVIICTPVHSHYLLSQQALTAGKHLLCEKPLSYTADECMALYHLAKDRGLTLVVGHVFEYHPVVQYMKRLISSGEIGTVQYLQLTRMGLGLVRSDVNVIYDLAAHDVAIVLSLLDQLPTTVVATGTKSHQGLHEDVAFLQLEFATGVIASIGVSWIDPIKQRLVKVVGDRKMLLFDDVSMTEKLKIIERGTNYQDNTGDFGSFQLAIKDGEITIPNIPHPEPLVTELEHFVACMHGRELPLTDARYAAQVVAVLEAAQQSLQQGVKIRLA